MWRKTHMICIFWIWRFIYLFLTKTAYVFYISFWSGKEIVYDRIDWLGGWATRSIESGCLLIMQ
jgi:hypothetical protein